MLDIVVVNYHTPTDLDAFLASLGSHPPKLASSLTVVEVDAGLAYEDAFTWGDDYPGLTLGVASNIGYARACNLASTRVEGDVLAFFNADVVLAPGALDECYEALTSNPWGVLGPRQVDTRGRIRHAGIFGSLAQPKHRGWNELAGDRYVDVLPAVTVSGSAYFVRKSVWDELTGCHLYRDVARDAEGAFLPTPHYYEETWCSYHAQAHGHRVMYYGPTTIVHKWHQASPVGGWAEQQFPVSRQIFREACDHHGIAHD